MDVQDLKARARDSVVKGRLERAEVLYRQVVTLVPRDAPAWIRHAETLRRLNRMDDAVWSYRTASTILLSLGHEARAIAGLKLALELKPDDVDLVTEIIRVEMHRKRRHAAVPVGTKPAEPVQVVTLKDLERKQLALPMLGEVDLRATAGSGIQPMPLEAAAPPTEAPRTRGGWPQVRRLSEREVAVKGAPDARWVVVSSTASLDVRFVATLEVDVETPWLE